ncbi:MAG: ATP-binding protein [Alphaproteobacteria bacterium]
MASLPPGDPLLAAAARFSDVHGILPTALGPMLVAATPVMPSADTGPANGTLVFGRLLTDTVVAAVADETQVRFSAEPLAADADAVAGDYAVVARSPDLLVGALVLGDIHGNPALRLRVETPRDVTGAGDRIIGISLLALVLAGLLAIAVLWLLLQRTVVRPLARVTGDIQAIRQTGRLDRRLAIAGAEEFQALGLEFNRMLDRLDAVHRQLVERTRDAEAAQAGAERANEAKSSFLTNMSHELRTPLNAIIGFSDLMQHEAFGPLGHAKYREYVDDIRDSGRHLLALINAILHLAQASNSKLILDEATVPLDELIDAALRLVQPAAMAGSVDVFRVQGPAAPAVRVDRTKLSQVLINILSNAVKFTPPGGQVRVAVRGLADGGLEIEVTDTGIGMRPEDIPEALKPFTQVHDGRDGRLPGTGLGLPLSVALMELHQGSLSLESRLGQGTTVLLRLPAARVAAKPAARSADQIDAMVPPST